MGVPNVEVAVHHCARIEAAVPTPGPAGPAPRSESGNPWQHGVLFFERKVIDQDLGKIRRIRREPSGSILAACGAPRFPIRKRVGMQHHFVGAGSAGFPGPSNYLVTPDVPGPKL